MIEALLAIPGDPEVKIYDHRKSMNQDDGDSPSTAIYDFDIDVINDTLTPEEIAEIKEVHGFTPNPIIALFFNNEDFDEDGKDLREND